MTRLILLTLVSCSLALSSVIALTGCNTVQGIGQDTRETGDFITGTPRRDAYHVDARDF